MNANYNTHKDITKYLLRTKLIDGVVVLLSHGNKDIVYLSLGVLMNILNDSEVREKNFREVIPAILALIDDCQLDDVDIIT